VTTTPPPCRQPWTPNRGRAWRLYNLSRADDALLIGLDLVKGYARTTDPSIVAGELAADVAGLRRALEILAGHVLLNGLTFSNLHLNGNDLSGKFRSLASGTDAREMVQRIVAAEPVLARIVSDRYPQQTRGRLTEPEYLEYIESTLDSDPRSRAGCTASRRPGPPSRRRAVPDRPRRSRSCRRTICARPWPRPPV
jgi:hypothetical protein